MRCVSAFSSGLAIRASVPDRESVENDTARLGGSLVAVLCVVQWMQQVQTRARNITNDVERRHGITGVWQVFVC